MNRVEVLVSKVNEVEAGREGRGIPKLMKRHPDRGTRPGGLGAALSSQSDELPSVRGRQQAAETGGANDSSDPARSSRFERALRSSPPCHLPACSTIPEHDGNTPYKSATTAESAERTRLSDRRFNVRRVPDAPPLGILETAGGRFSPGRLPIRDCARNHVAGSRRAKRGRERVPR